MKPEIIAVGALGCTLVIGIIGVCMGHNGALLGFIAGLGALLGAYIGVKKV